jgi:hypothetical protein
MPFSAAETGHELPSTVKSERAMQSMVHRYPLNRKSEQWSQLNGMEPATFKRDLLGWQARFIQLQQIPRAD